jgi:hypothetical protein
MTRATALIIAIIAIAIGAWLYWDSRGPAPEPAAGDAGAPATADP